MALYAYKAMDPAGRRIAGRMEAANAADLETRVKRIDLDLIDGAPVRQSTGWGANVSRRERINFCFHLEQLARAGVPLIEALADLRDSVDDRRLREVLAAMVAAIEGGKTLSQAMAEHPTAFDAITTQLVHAGETSGRLPEVLADLVESLKWQDELAAQARRLMTYPLFLVALMLVLIFFMMIHLVPQMASFMKNMGEDLPLHTQLLIGVSGFFVSYWYLLLGLPLLAGAALRFAVRAEPRARRALDDATLRVPLLGDILRKIILARFARSFAMMYGAGIPVLDTLRANERIVGNAAIAAGLQRAGDMIAEGVSVTQAFQRTHLFPPLVVRMLRVGESSGALERALSNVAYFYTRDVREAIARLQTLVEPAMTVAIGAVMGWVMLAVLGPIYDVIARLKI